MTSTSTSTKRAEWSTDDDGALKHGFTYTLRKVGLKINRSESECLSRYLELVRRAAPAPVVEVDAPASDWTDVEDATIRGWVKDPVGLAEVLPHKTFAQIMARRKIIQ